MEYSLRCENVVLTVLDRQQMNEKLDRLKKLIRDPYVVDVSLIHTSHPGAPITCIVNIEQGKKVFHAQREGNSIQTALDQVVEALSSEMKRWQEKRRSRERVRV